MSPPSRSPSSGRTKIRPRYGGRAPRRSGSDGCAPSRTAIWPRRPSPGSRCAKPCAEAHRRRCSRPSRTATTLRSTTSSRTRAECVRAPAGIRAFTRSRVERIRAIDGGFELDGDGPFAHVLVATGPPGLARPDGLPARGARLRAARLRDAGDDRRRRHGGGDRVAERPRHRRRGDFSAAPRAGTPAAQRPAAALLQAWARRVPRRLARGTRNDDCASSRRRPTPPAPPGTSRCAPPSATAASASHPR